LDSYEWKSQKVEKELRIQKFISKFISRGGEKYQKALCFLFPKVEKAVGTSGAF